MLCVVRGDRPDGGCVGCRRQAGRRSDKPWLICRGIFEGIFVVAGTCNGWDGSGSPAQGCSVPAQGSGQGLAAQPVPHMGTSGLSSYCWKRCLI